MTFEDFGFHEDLIRGVHDMGYRTPTPIQERALPPALAGRDVIGIAQTGTGKTAAFLLPILHRILQAGPERKRTTRALILAPTRELALQIDEVRLGLAYHTDLSGCAVYGGADMLQQTRALKGRPDVVTATPGRLLDHLWHGLPALGDVETFVLDEADRMLDMGFLPDLEKIVRRLPERRQNLLFSATMPPEIERLAREMMTDPVQVSVGPRRRPVELVDQRVLEIPSDRKPRALLDLVRRPEVESALVFTRTKSGADLLFRELRKAGVSCAVIHGDRDQSERFRALESFRQGTTKVLVATDVAARGIDVEGISHVVNYDVPNSGEDYLHRIGRTARAGQTGHAVTFVTREETREWRAIERTIGTRVPSLDGRARREEAETRRAGSQAASATTAQRRGGKRGSSSPTERPRSRGGDSKPSGRSQGRGADGRAKAKHKPKEGGRRGASRPEAKGTPQERPPRRAPEDRPSDVSEGRRRRQR